MLNWKFWLLYKCVRADEYNRVVRKEIRKRRTKEFICEIVLVFLNIGSFFESLFTFMSKFLGLFGNLLIICLWFEVQIWIMIAAVAITVYDSIKHRISTDHANQDDN